MRYVSQKEFRRSVEHGYTGTYYDYDGKHPEWKGKRTIMTGDDGPGTNLYIEGISFEIVPDDDPRCPKRYEISFYSGWQVTEPLIDRKNKYFKNEQEAEEWAKANIPFERAGYRVCLVE